MKSGMLKYKQIFAMDSGVTDECKALDSAERLLLVLQISHGSIVLRDSSGMLVMLHLRSITLHQVSS